MLQSVPARPVHVFLINAQFTHSRGRYNCMFCGVLFKLAATCTTCNCSITERFTEPCACAPLMLLDLSVPFQRARSYTCIITLNYMYVVRNSFHQKCNYSTHTNTRTYLDQLQSLHQAGTASPAVYNTGGAGVLRLMSNRCL